MPHFSIRHEGAAANMMDLYQTTTFQRKIAFRVSRAAIQLTLPNANSQ